MGSISIIDGRTHNSASVDKNHRLLNKGFVESSKEISATEGHRYSASSGIVTLTDATESALFYVKNTGDDDFYVTNLFANIDVSTGGTKCAKVRVYKSVTTGTLISGASAATANNFDFGSANEPDAIVYKGVQGSTRTDGSLVTAAFIKEGREVLDFERLIIPKNGSIVITVQPPASNTSQDVLVGLTGYVNDPVISGE